MVFVVEVLFVQHAVDVEVNIFLRFSVYGVFYLMLVIDFFSSCVSPKLLPFLCSDIEVMD